MRLQLPGPGDPTFTCDAGVNRIIQKSSSHHYMRHHLRGTLQILWYSILHFVHLDILYKVINNTMCVFRTSQIGETIKDILSQHHSTTLLVPNKISQDTHLWHEAFNSNVYMIQRKVCLFRCPHRPRLKRNHSVYLTTVSLIYAILIFHFSFTQDAFDTV